jgi:hypothetical protein
MKPEILALSSAQSLSFEPHSWWWYVGLAIVAVALAFVLRAARK